MVKFLVYLLGYVIYPFSFLMPRNGKVWAFGSYRGGVGDNAKYLYLYVCTHYPQIKAVWISPNRKTVKAVRALGYSARFIGSPAGLWTALRAKYWFFNAYTSDILFFASGGAVCVNLWHGVGLKKIEFCVEDGPLRKRYVEKRFWERFYYPQVFRRPDYLLSSTEFQSVKFAQAFRIPVARCLNLGYPRNRILTMPDAERRQFVARYEPVATGELIAKASAYRKVYIYMPTWRDSQKQLFTQVLDLEALNKEMERQQALFILKPHPNTVVDASLLRPFSHILCMDRVVDVYTVLPYTDVLITDYSSILYDYILMDGKAVILYLYDYEKYVKDRDFNYPFSENVAGTQVHSFTQLLQCLADVPQAVPEAELLPIRKKFWGEGRGDVCRDLIDKVIR